MNIEFVLPKLHDKQNEVANDKANIRTVCAGRQSGKSFLARKEIIKRMLQGKDCGYLTPDYKIARTFFKNMIESTPEALIKSKNKSELTIEFHNGGLVEFFTNNNVDSIRGKTKHFWVIDEAAFIVDLDYALNTVIIPTMTTSTPEVLLISTPYGYDYFYSLYQKGIDKEPGYSSFYFTLYDSPYVNQTTIDFLLSITTERVWKQEYLALPELGDTPFGNTSHLIKPLSKKPTILYSVDLGRKIDETAIYGYDEDGCLTYEYCFRKDWPETENILAALDQNITMVVDGHGIGDVVIQHLRLKRKNVQSMIYGKEKEKMMLNLQRLIDNNEVSMTEALSTQFNTIESFRTHTGYIKFQARQGYHDDKVMSFAMGHWFLSKNKKVTKSPFI